LPHYARFVAILDPYMPDVGAGVVDLVSFPPINIVGQIRLTLSSRTKCGISSARKLFPHWTACA
jgi:hypothetical protein